MSRDQPSIVTNRKSLKGTDIIVGDTIDMPMAIRIVVTIRSIVMNGR